MKNEVTDVQRKLSSIKSYTFKLSNGWFGKCYFSLNELYHGQVEDITSDRSFWASKNWLMAVEKMPGPQMFFLCIENNVGEVLGILPCQYMTESEPLVFYDIPQMIIEGGNFGNESLLSDFDKKRMKSYRNILHQTKLNLYPSLVGATPSSFFALCIKNTYSKRQKVADGLVELFEIIASTLKVKSKGMLYVYNEQERLVKSTLRDLNYQEAILGADAVIDIRWKTFDDFLKSLKKKRRANVRRERKAFVNSDVDVEVRQGYEALSQELIDLQLALRIKYGIGGSSEEIKQKFNAMNSHLGRYLVAFTAKKNESIQGFSLFFNYQKVLYSYIAGFDYHQLEDFTYFNLVIYEPLIWAMEQGLEKIRLGLSSYEAKMRRGARLIKNKGYFSFDQSVSMSAENIVDLLSRTEKIALQHFERHIDPFKS